jgi:hypothetical protein
MSVSSLTPQLSHELSALRRRAYGPDADIAHDPEAQRRLDQLEALARSAASDVDAAPASPSEPLPGTPSAPVVDVDAIPSPAPGEPAPAADPAAGSDGADDENPSDAAPVAPREHLWTRIAAAARRLPWWAAPTAAGVLGLLVGLLIPASLAVRPDAALARTGESASGADSDWVAGLFEWLHIEDELAVHESFHEFEVLSGTNSRGATCLIVLWPDQWADGRCLPGDVPPVIDYTVYPGGPRPLDDGMPLDSVLRFELRGDVVTVVVQEAGPAET